MLALAGEKRLYDELVKADLTTYLQRAPGAFDVIVSADALVYFGDLQDVAAAAAGALRRRGVFVFTLEEMVGASSSAGYRLEHTAATPTRSRT